MHNLDDQTDKDCSAMTTFQSRASSMSSTTNANNDGPQKVSEDDTFVSATDLSSVLSQSEAQPSQSTPTPELETSQTQTTITSQISITSGTSGDSTSTSTTSSISTSGSSRDSYSSTSSATELSSKSKSKLPLVSPDTSVNPPVMDKDALSTTLDPEKNPFFATCSSTSVSSQGQVRRSESWSGLRSASVDSGQSQSRDSNSNSEYDFGNNECGGGGIETNSNTTSKPQSGTGTGAGDRESVSSMNDLEQSDFTEALESQSQSKTTSDSTQNFQSDTYHTPSASMHNIVPRHSSEPSNKFRDESKISKRISEDSSPTGSGNSGHSGNSGLVEVNNLKNLRNDEAVNDIYATEADAGLEAATKAPATSPKLSSSRSSYEEDDKMSECISILAPEEDDSVLNLNLNLNSNSNSNEISAADVALALAHDEASICGGNLGIVLPVGQSLSASVTPTKVLNSRGKPMKKRMWYQQIFSASYKSRSGDFKKLFKELPLKERLLVDYSCALQKEILVQGRMYVSQGYLSFHANIFGWETQTSIKMKEITSITKEKTALVIPNAIQVATDSGDKLFFTSFVTRDATFMMLFKLWQTALLEDSLPSKEIQRLIHTSYGEELVITSDDETEESLSLKSLGLNQSPLLKLKVKDLKDISDAGLVTVCDFDRRHKGKSIVIDSQVCSGDIAPAIIVSGNLSSSIITSKAQGHEEDYLTQNGVGLVPVGSRLGVAMGVGMDHSDVTESSDSDEDFQAAEGIVSDEMDAFDPLDIPSCPTSHLEGRETINAIIPCNIDQLFTMLFTNSKFYLDFHTDRKTFNIHQSPWEIGKDGKKTRQVSMTVSLNAVMGPKHSQVTETQVMQTMSQPGRFYMIESESINAGVPYADTFAVTIHYCLTRVNAGESKLVVVNQIIYKKSVWGITKSIIEKNAWAGIEEFYSHLERALKEECTKMMNGSSPIPSPKMTASNLPRRRAPRKRKAPDVPIGAIPLLPRGSLRSGIYRGSISVEPLGAQMADTRVEPSSTPEGFVALKIILSVLSCLLLLNAFLYFKLNRLETTATTLAIFPPHSFSFTETDEIPQNHQDWLLLLQKQETLHRIELQKWHEILMSALKILHKAESDLEALKFHISSYSGGKYSVDIEDVGVGVKNMKTSPTSEQTQSQSQGQEGQGADMKNLNGENKDNGKSIEL